MSTYVITGVSKGLGFEFVKQLSEDPENLVIGLVRDKATTEAKLKEELGARPNVQILHGDLTSYDSLKNASADTEKFVGERGIDYLVANGGYLPLFDAYDPIGALGSTVEELENVLSKLNQTNLVGNIHLFNIFLPLVMKSKLKKVIVLTSGHADLDLINDLEIETSALYAASKAALNAIVAKYNAQYKKDGVLFVSISPGVVDNHFTDVTPKQMEAMQAFASKMATYAPHFKGPMTVEEAVRINKALWEKVSIDAGYGGAFVSHFGNKQWV